MSSSIDGDEPSLLTKTPVMVKDKYPGRPIIPTFENKKNRDDKTPVARNGINISEQKEPPTVLINGMIMIRKPYINSNS